MLLNLLVHVLQDCAYELKLRGALVAGGYNGFERSATKLCFARGAEVSFVLFVEEGVVKVHQDEREDRHGKGLANVLLEGHLGFAALRRQKLWCIRVLRYWSVKELELTWYEGLLGHRGIPQCSTSLTHACL